MDNALRQLFDGTDITYKINGKSIVLVNDDNVKTEGAPRDAGKGVKHSIRGKVVDDKGEPVIGSNIKVKGENIGCVTDINGNFALDADDNSTLEVSYVGYLTQIVPVKGRNRLNIVMKEDLQGLDEVVVV